jgi:hypothetical protein
MPVGIVHHLFLTRDLCENLPICHSEEAERPKNLVFNDKVGGADDYKQIGYALAPKTRFFTPLRSVQNDNSKLPL